MWTSWILSHVDPFQCWSTARCWQVVWSDEPLFFPLKYVCDQSYHNRVIKLVKKKQTLTAKTFCVVLLISPVNLTEYSMFSNSTEHTVKNKHDKTKLFQTVCSVTDDGFFLFQRRLMVPTFTIFDHKSKPVRFSYISEDKPLGLLQGFVVFLQHNPSLGSHEAIGGIGPLPRHLSHTCAWDEIVILVAGKKEKRGSESQHISNQWKDAYQQHRKYKQYQPAALESVTDSWRSSSSDSFQQKHSKV